MYKSARDSESDDKDEVSQEMKKIAREVGDNTNGMNDLSTSTIKHVKEIKSDMKSMSVGIKSDFIFIKDQATNLESYVDNLEISTKKTQQDVSNLLVKVNKISADTIKHEEAQANTKKFEDAIESALTKVSDEKHQQDIKIDELMKQIKDLEEKIPDSKKANDEVQELKILLKVRIIQFGGTE